MFFPFFEQRKKCILFNIYHYNRKLQDWNRFYRYFQKRCIFATFFYIQCGMDGIFFGLLAIGITVELFTKGGDAALASLIGGAKEAVTGCITMSGAYLFWMGLMGILKETGLMHTLSRVLRPVLRFLFPDAGGAGEAITMNLSCNMLGLGNAATPYGLEAMRIMEAENPHPGVATGSMCVLLAVNASCLELFPASLIALRQSYGSVMPTVVVLPVLLSSACSTAVTVLLCRLCLRFARI